MPNGIKEAINALIEIISFHWCWKCTSPRFNTYKTNNTPCAIPMDLTKEGSWYRYFIGIAIPSKRRKEMPSKKAKIRSRSRVRLIVA